MSEVCAESDSSRDDVTDRSEWFRKSVLFWSSQSKEKTSPTHSNKIVNRDEIDSMKHLTRKTLTDRNASEIDSSRHIILHNNKSQNNMNSLSTTTSSTMTVVNSRGSRKVQMTSTVNQTEAVYKENMSTVNSHTPSSKQPIEEEEGEEKQIKFDPSELLRQVEELERCFLENTKPANNLISTITQQVYHNNDSKNSSPNSSPHMTLEFPNGSSIQSNPLYKQEEDIKSDSQQLGEKSRGLSTAGVFDCSTSVEQSKNPVVGLTGDYHNTSFDDLNVLLGIAETAVLNDKRNSFNQQNSIQSVTTATGESIQRSDNDINTVLVVNRDDNQKYSFEETESFTELMGDCIQQSTPRTQTITQTQSIDDQDKKKNQSIKTSDNNKNRTNLSIVTDDSDQKTFHNNYIRMNNDSYFVESEKSQLTTISQNDYQNMSSEVRKNNGSMLTHVKKQQKLNLSDNMVHSINVEENNKEGSSNEKEVSSCVENTTRTNVINTSETKPFQEADKLDDKANVLTIDEIPILPTKNYKLQTSESNTVNSSTNSTTDTRIIDGIQRVQDTLYEISREIHCSNTKRHSRDPNIVLQAILSNIKPPSESEVNAKEKLSVVTPVFENGIQRDVISDTMATSIDYYSDPEGARRPKGVLMTPLGQSAPNGDDLYQQSKQFHLKSEDLLKQIDSLIENEQTEQKHQSLTKPVKPKRVSKKSSEKYERKDSGLHSTSSGSNSPYPSPNANRQLSPATNKKLDVNPMDSFQPPLFRHQETIIESLREYDDVFNNDDSDFSSDWSPISTLESVSSTRTRSNSLPRPPVSYYNSLNHHEYKERHFSSKANMSDSNILRNTQIYNDHELKAIRKFLTLTSKCLDHKDDDGTDGTKDPLQSLEELSLIPSIKASIASHRKELKEQRMKQEEFLHQIGDLLLEVVTLKEEHSTVRSKQAKALSLLKKQLDLMKKQQSKVHKDVLSQVNDLNDRLNSSLSDQPQTPSSPLNSPKLVTPRSRSISSNLSSSPYKNYGQIIWKVSDIMKKLTRIKSGLMDAALVSQPFQTSEYGYKMNAWLYLNGRGKTVGKYVSLYVCVLVGEYDPILPWPIQPSYKFTLIDQKSDLNKRCNFVKVRNVFDIADKGANVISQNGGIPKPHDGSKALIVGFDDFISHEQLLEKRYLADDIMFLKVEAEVNYE